MGGIVGESTGNELLLGHAILLNCLVLTAAWRFARRFTNDHWQAAIDALLIWLLIQYASVILPGLAGALNRWTMSAAALLFAALLAFFSRRNLAIQITIEKPGERYVIAGCVFFFAGYLAALVYHQRFIPVMADDALTYHLPAAVRWLQTGRLVLHETWLFNPANTYSPLAGSTFIAWWLAPMGNDYLARFVQIPALVLIFVSMAQLCRLLGATAGVSTIIALAAALSRPFISQAILAKDDLYLAAFFLSAVVALSKSNLQSKFGGVRLGAAIGLFIATKYTALLALPILALAIDAPWRVGWRWKSWTTAAGVAALHAGPWFIRNIWLTGNPLFPIEIKLAGVRIFPGMFETARSLELRTFRGVWNVVTQGYFSIPIMLLAALSVVWLIVVVARCRQAARDNLLRICLIGPIIGACAFVFGSPYPEVRFLDPSFLLLFATIAALPLNSLAFNAVALLLAAISISTGFVDNMGLPFISFGALATAIGLGLIAAQEHILHLKMRSAIALGVAACVIAALFAYVYTDATINQYASDTETAWQQQYGPIGEAWTFVREHVPADATVAYTNTYFLYPLMGFNGQRKMVYAPCRPGVERLADLPKFPRPVAGEEMAEMVGRVTTSGAERELWMKNLRKSEAKYLFILKKGVVVETPEEQFVRDNASEFKKVFMNEAGEIFLVK